MSEQEQRRESLHVQLSELIQKLRHVLDNGPRGCIPEAEAILKDLQVLLPELNAYVEEINIQNDAQ